MREMYVEGFMKGGKILDWREILNWTQDTLLLFLLFQKTVEEIKK